MFSPYIDSGMDSSSDSALGSDVDHESETESFTLEDIRKGYKPIPGRFREAFAPLSDKKYLQRISERDSNEMTFIHSLVSRGYHELLDTALQMVKKPSDRLTLLAKRTDRDCTVFHLAVMVTPQKFKAQIIEILLQYVHETDRLDILRMADKYERTALRYAVDNCTVGVINDVVIGVIKLLLQSIPPDEANYLISMKPECNCKNSSIYDTAVQVGNLELRVLFDKFMDNTQRRRRKQDIDASDQKRASRGGEKLPKLHQHGHSLIEHLELVGLKELIDDIAIICCRNTADGPPAPSVNFGRDHDKIFDKLWSRSEGHGAETAVSCILVSYKVGDRAPEDILILAKGDVPMVTDYSRSGENYSWRISRLKLWSKPLTDLVEFQQLTISNIEQYPLHKVFKLKNLSAERDAMTQISPSLDGNTLIYHTSPMILRLAQPLVGEKMTAVFLLLTDFNLVDQIAGTFEEIKTESVCSDGSEASIFIDELDQEEDINTVTIIELSAKTESSVMEYLYYMVAGNLPDLCEKESTATHPVTTRVHYITNDLLHQEITEKFSSGESIQGILPVKMENMKKNCPPFVVTSALPKIENKLCVIRELLSPKNIEISCGIEKYIFGIGSKLVLRLHEPQSPPKIEIDGVIYTVELSAEPSMVWKEELDKAQFDLFRELSQKHDQQGTIHENHAVTALTVLIYHKESGVSKQVIFIPRLVYGDDLLDVNTCPFAGGCRISAVPFYNEKLRADIESKWRVKSASATDGDVLPHIWDENRILDSSLDDITIKSCKKHGKKYLEVRCPAVSTRECSFYEVTNSEVDGAEVKKMRTGFEDIHDYLFEAETYLAALLNKAPTSGDGNETKYGNSASKINTNNTEKLTQVEDAEATNEDLRHQSGTGEDEESVMINVHLLKSKIKRGRSRNRRQRMTERTVLESEIVIIVANGNKEDLHIPESFSHHNPLSAWYSKSKFVRSKPLRNAIEHNWEAISTRDKSVAQHLAFVCEGKTEVKVLNTFMEKAKVGGRTLLEVQAHGPDDKALRNVVAKNVREKHESKNGDPFPESLPNSFMYAVAKFKHMILPKPNQLGMSSEGLAALFLLFHDAAHNKFALPNAEARTAKIIT